MNKKIIMEKVDKLLKEEESIISYEKKHGLQKDFFFAYSNMLRELLPIYNSDEIYEIWKKYRIQVKINNELRALPGLFSSSDNVNGFDNILRVIDNGGIIFSYHYGNYRVGIGSIIRCFEEYGYAKKLNIIIDSSALKYEPQNLKNSSKNINYICSEDITIGLEIFKKLDLGEWFFIFLDGNSGYGKDNKSISLDFISSNINLRSGIFRLMSITRKPFLPMTATKGMGMGKDIFEIGDNINKGISYKELAIKCYEPFIELVKKNPQNWRLWYSHNKQVNTWFKVNPKKNIELWEYKLHIGEKTFAINLCDGCIYKMQER